MFFTLPTQDLIPVKMRRLHTVFIHVHHMFVVHKLGIEELFDLDGDIMLNTHPQQGHVGIILMSG